MGSPQAPSFDFSQVPKKLTYIASHDFSPPDLKGKSKAVVAPDQRFWRRAKWSPEGTHLLAQTDDHALDLFQLLDGGDESTNGFSASKGSPPLRHVFRVTAPTTLLDWTWYPFARLGDPATFCFVFSARDVPVRLIDAASGATRATYGIENHIEQFVAPNALAFSCDGTSLYCGHATSISLFALAEVGTNTCSTVALVPTKASNGPSVQKGIVSSIAVAPMYGQDGTLVGEILAVGTFNGTVGVYQRTSMQRPGRWIDAAKQPNAASGLCVAGWIETQGTGVMQTAFHPTAPHILFLRTRGNSQPIRAYDLRYMNTTPHFLCPPSDSSLIALFRKHDHEDEQQAQHITLQRYQQRLCFDVDWTGQWLISGDHQGDVSVWSLGRDETAEEETERLQERQIRTPKAHWNVSNDTIGSVSMHPLRSYLLTVSGSRCWPDEPSADGGTTSTDTDTDSDDDSDSETNTAAPSQSLRWFVKDGGLTIWEAGSRTEDKA